MGREIIWCKGILGKVIIGVLVRLEKLGNISIEYLILWKLVVIYEESIL